MAPSRSRTAGPLCGLLAVLGMALPPAAAVAEGPGYGGTADTVTVQWQADGGQAEELAVYAVGFRSGSPIAVRVGAAADERVYADGAGALQVLVVNQADLAAAEPPAGMTVLPVDTGIAGRLSPGMSVQVSGHDPAGGIRTLVGAVPPPAAGNGVQDVVPWAAVVAAMLLGSGLLTRRAWPGRLGPTVRRYQHAARHRARRATALSE